MKSAFNFETIYPSLPVFLQNVACGLYGLKESRIRLGKTFRQKLEELMISDRWSASEIEAYQNERLQSLIKHAYERVPFYRERMQSLKLAPEDIRTRADLHKLPVLTKEDVRNNSERLLSEDAKKKELVFKHTSGTTGKSLHFYVSRAAVAFQWAVWWRHRQQFGLKPESWHVNFTGKMAIPPSQAHPPYWRWNRPVHQAIVNMHHLTREKIADIVEFLNEHEFEFYSGYPSIIHAMSLTAMEAGLKLTSPPKVIDTGAENMLDYQREEIRKFTGAILTDQYGSSETCGNASQCTEFVYHEDFEFGILECVDGATLEDGSRRGKIVCTGFASPEFPFIRYEVGDVGTWQEVAKRCECGRASSVLTRIEGREDDYVLTPEGTRIMRFDYVFKDAQHVRECQVVQENLGEVKLKIVRRPAYSQADETELEREIHHWISPRLKVVFAYVDEIERGRNGKFRAVKSLLKQSPSQN